MSERQRFGEILVRAGVLDRSRLDLALKESKAEGLDLGEYIVQRKIADQKTVLDTISTSMNLPVIELSKVKPDPQALELVPAELCRDYLLLPLEVERSRTGEHLHVAMANPANVKAIKKVTRAARLRLRPLVAAASELRAAISVHLGMDLRPEPPTGSMDARPVTGSLDSLPASMALADAISMGGSLQPDPATIALEPPTVATDVSGGNSDSLFDFGVTDLSGADDGGGLGMLGDLAPPAPAPPAPAPPAAAPPAPPRPAAPEPAPDHAAPPLSPPEPPPDARAGGFSVVRGRRSRGGVEDAFDPGLQPPPSPVPAAPSPPAAAHPAAPEPAAPPPGPPQAGVRRRAPRASSSPPAAHPPAPAAAAPPAAEPGLPPLPRLPRPASGDGPGPRRERASLEGMMPSEMIDDGGTLDVGALLQSFTERIEEEVAPEDEIIADHLSRYGKDRAPATGESTFEALDRALSRVRPGAGQVVVGLIRYLARRGLVDPEELVREIQDG